MIFLGSKRGRIHKEEGRAGGCRGAWRISCDNVSRAAAPSKLSPSTSGLAVNSPSGTGSAANSAHSSGNSTAAGRRTRNQATDSVQRFATVNCPVEGLALVGLD